jgi:hypothetical protein
MWFVVNVSARLLMRSASSAPKQLLFSTLHRLVWGYRTRRLVVVIPAPARAHQLEVVLAQLHRWGLVTHFEFLRTPGRPAVGRV